MQATDNQPARQMARNEAVIRDTILKAEEQQQYQSQSARQEEIQTRSQAAIRSGYFRRTVQYYRTGVRLGG